MEAAHIDAAPRRRPLLRRWWLAAAILVTLACLVDGPTLFHRYRNWRLRRESIPVLERAVRAHPADVDATYALGLAYAQANRYHEATAAFLAVLARDPARADVLNDLGVTYMLQERYYESLVALQGALSVRPHFAAARANLGRLHLATKMPFTAVRDLQAAVADDPSDPEARCDLGEAYRRTLNLDAAKREYQTVLSSNPNHLRALTGLGQTLHALGDMRGAQAALRHALRLQPNNPDALDELARVEMDRTDTSDGLAEAQKLVDKAHRAAPMGAGILYDEGRLALRFGHPAQAVSYLAQTLRLAPDYAAAMHELERALRADGRTADADHVGRIFQARALRDREETRLEEVVSRDPSRWNDQARLARIYLESGQRGLALLVVRRLESGAPNNPALPALRRDVAAALAGVPPGR